MSQDHPREGVAFRHCPRTASLSSESSWLPLLGLAAGVGSQHRAAGSHTDSYTGFASLSLYAETSYGCPRPKRALKTAAPGEALGGVGQEGCALPQPPEGLQRHRHCQRAYVFLHFPAGSTKASCSNKMYIVTHLLRNGSKGSGGRDSFRQLGPSRVWLPAGGGRAGARPGLGPRPWIPRPGFQGSSDFEIVDLWLVTVYSPFPLHLFNESSERPFCFGG